MLCGVVLNSILELNLRKVDFKIYRDWLFDAFEDTGQHWEWKVELVKQHLSQQLLTRSWYVVALPGLEYCHFRHHFHRPVSHPAFCR